MNDPFEGLDPEWAKAAERRAVRANRLRRLRLRRPRWRRPGKAVTVLLVAGVAVAAIFGAEGLHWSPAGTGAYTRQSLPPGLSVTTSASARPTGPFEGTPVESYARGEDGITLPPAQAVEGFTAAQVESFLNQVRAALVAGRLDRRMLTGHDPAVLLQLLDPDERPAMQQRLTEHRSNAIATWIDPKATLDPAEQPRVSGRVTYSSQLSDGRPTLRVTTNFVWAYAFTGSGLATRFAAVHDELQWTSGPRGGLWLVSANAYSAYMDCASSKAGLLAPARDDAVGGPAPSSTGAPEKMANYLRPDHTLAIADGCP